MRTVVLRYASIGDAIQASSPIAELHDDGDDVTLITSPDGEVVLRHDPHIDKIIIMPPSEIGGDYGDWIAKHTEGYDRVCNLTYSTEGELLTEPQNRNYYLPDKVRRALYGTVNYIERHHVLCDVPFRTNRQWFYETADELAQVTEALSGCVSVGIALSGSHPYKIWPHLPEFCVHLLNARPVRLVLLGAFDGRDVPIAEKIYAAIQREIGPLDNPNIEIMSMLGSKLRLNLAMACHVDVLVGPETGATNAAAMRQNHKIVMLSHSTETNLTRDWINTASLTSPAPCSPCLRLRHRKEDCPTIEGSPACVSLMTPQRVLRETLRSISLVEASLSELTSSRLSDLAERSLHPARCS